MTRIYAHFISDYIYHSWGKNVKAESEVQVSGATIILDLYIWLVECIHIKLKSYTYSICQN